MLARSRLPDPARVQLAAQARVLESALVLLARPRWQVLALDQTQEEGQQIV